MMKKFILFCMVTICTLCFCFHTLAIEPTSYVVTIDNVSVIFSTNSNLTENEKHLIAEHLIYGESDIQTYGLLCNLFGHKNTTEIVTTITHCVNSTVPRCLEEYWEIQICSRCDNVESTVIDYNYINCCPVD